MRGDVPRCDGPGGDGLGDLNEPLLMMMAEHDIHHRSQIMTYAGINRWPVQQVFGRTYEEVLRRTRAGHATSGDGSPRDGGSS